MSSYFLPDAKQEKCSDLILWSQIYEDSSVESEALVFILFYVEMYKNLIAALLAPSVPL